MTLRAMASPMALVEAVVGAVAEEEGLITIGHLVVVVAQLVMDGDKIVRRGLEAGLDAHVRARCRCPQALAWQTTSRSRGWESMERFQKVSGSGSKPRGLVEAFAVLHEVGRSVLRALRMTPRS